MATNASTTTAVGILKTLYPQKRIEDVCYRNNPFFSKVKKNTNFGGNNIQIALRYATQAGRATDFATAKSNATANAYGKFLLTRNKDYAVGGIETEVLRAATEPNALANELKESLDGLTYIITRSLCNALYGNGGGALTQIIAVGVGTFTPVNGIPGQTVTMTANQFLLSNANNVVWFEIGMVLEAAITDGTSGSRRAGQMIVTAVDRDNGVITCAAGIVAGLAAADYIFAQNDFGLKLKGLAAWLPATPPTAGDNFFGQDRSLDTVRMAGVRWAGNGLPLEETIQTASARLFREGSRPDSLFMNPMDLNNLVLSTNSKVIIMEDGGKTPTTGFKTIRFTTQMGEISCYSDPNCPSGVGYLLQMDTWTLYSLGDAPGFLDDDGQGKMLRDISSDSIQFRMAYFAQLACTAPGYNCRITF